MEEVKLTKTPSWEDFHSARPLHCPHCHKEVYLRRERQDSEDEDLGCSVSEDSMEEREEEVTEY